MRCEIISIGTEFLSGRSGKSAPVLAKALSSIGIKISDIIITGDEETELNRLFLEVFDRADIIITIGGLGSTPDDITKDVVSKALNVKQEFSRIAMENVARYFSSIGKDTPKECDDQGNIIKGAKILPNSKGSSPGQLIELDNKTIILLPGPKVEVEHIITNNLMDILKEKYERLIRKTLVLHIINMCEAEVATLLKDVIETEKHLEAGEIEFYYQQKITGTDLAIICWGDNEMLVDEILHKIKTEIYEVLKGNIFGEDGTTIESVIGRLLTKKRKTLSAAESCTGGLLSSNITDAAGSSVYFKQSVVVYSNDAKVKMLNIDPGMIKKHGAVSETVAMEMASSIREIANTDYAISVTGYAGPSQEAKNKVGTGYIGLISPEETQVHKVEFSGSRHKIKEKFTATALEILWRTLSKK